MQNERPPLRALSNRNLIGLIDVLEDIEEELQVSPSDEGRIPVLPQIVRHVELFPGDGVGMRDRYIELRWKHAEMLGRAQLLYNVHFEDHGHRWQGKIGFIADRPKIATLLADSRAELSSRSGTADNTATKSERRRPVERPKAKNHDSAETSRRVFIVHGHDEGMKEAVARTLETLGLTPVILHEQPGKGRTIIEKFIDYSDVGFAIALLSPDDQLSLATSPGRRAGRESRARQNVIRELGFFLGRLGRERVATVFRSAPDIALPSDYAGVEFIPYDDAGAWRLKLCDELIAAGYSVDKNKL